MINLRQLSKKNPSWQDVCYSSSGHTFPNMWVLYMMQRLMINTDQPISTLLQLWVAKCEQSKENRLTLWLGTAWQTSINKLLKTEPCERHMFEQTGEIHQNRVKKSAVGTMLLDNANLADYWTKKINKKSNLSTAVHLQKIMRPKPKFLH